MNNKYPPWDFRNLITLNPIPIDFAIKALQRENIVEVVRTYNYLLQTDQMDDDISYIIFNGLCYGISSYSYPINSLYILYNYPELYDPTISGLELLRKKCPIMNYGNTYHHYDHDYSEKNIDSILSTFHSLNNSYQEYRRISMNIGLNPHTPTTCLTPSDIMYMLSEEYNTSPRHISTNH